jgi:hypothetical protein
MLIQDCVECYYSFDLRGCSNCFLSCNLRNKQYYFLNKQYTKEAYFEKLKEFKLSSSAVREELYRKYLDLLKKKALYRFAFIERSVNCSGNFVFASKNSRYLFDADKVENSAYLTTAPEIKDSMDAYHFGFATELVYECHALIHAYDNQFCHLSYHNRHIRYCDGCHNSEHLFGCVGLKQGRHCILNKRYDESAYKELVGKITEHMKKAGEYGEFSPAGLSPFGYNETQGAIYAPLSKEEVAEKGWKWEENVPGTFGKETLKPENILDSIENVQEGITGEVLACGNCGRNYNIVAPEFDFYRREGIPVPRRCPECRYRARLSLRPPRTLWKRQCMCDYAIHENTSVHQHHAQKRCPNEFETPYAPEREEVLYCEACYNSEIV